MRRSRALAAVAALGCVMASGCGVSSKEEIKPRDPSGQGETRGPDISVESIDALRSVEVAIAANRFQPQQVSISIDSTVRIVNESDKTAKIRALEGLGERLEEPTLPPGDDLELDFLDTGTERIALEGSDARLEISVVP